MKFTLVILTTIFTTIGITDQVLAQARTPAQEFFEQGWEQLEREIRTLQEDNPEAQENGQQQPNSKPLLEVSPKDESDTSSEIEGIELPNSQPAPVENGVPVN